MATIVHKTVYHGLSFLGPVSIPIPLTTAGNTLVIVQGSLWFPSYPVFNGVTAGWNPTGTTRLNTASNGFFGSDTISVLNKGSLIAYFVNIPGGISVVSYGNGAPRGQSGAAEWTVIYELTPCTVIDGSPSSVFVSEPPLVSQPVNGPAANGTYFCGIMTANINSGALFSGVSSPWTIDEQDIFTQVGGESGCAGVGIISGGSGTQQATWSGSSFNDYFATAIISLQDSGGGGGGGGGGGVPIQAGGGGIGGGPGTGGGCSSTLNISPATELYQAFVPASAMNASEYVTEGRTAVVIDFNAGDGLYARDIETLFAWGLSSHYAIRVWQPSLIQEPENQFNRPTDWNDGGSPGNKFIQGITIEADSFNLPKSFQLQSADDLSLHALNEMPATFIKQTIKTFSCVTPFLAHSIRIFATDGVAWRVWDSTPIFQPWPSQVMNWQTEQTSFGMQGWLHAREMNIAYASSQPITIVLDPDTGPTITLTLPSTGGPLIQAKTKQTLPPMKFKLLSMQVVSTAPFYLFEQDIEFKIKAWGSDGPYNVLKIVGGESRTGAKV